MIFRGYRFDDARLRILNWDYWTYPCCEIGPHIIEKRIEILSWTTGVADIPMCHKSWQDILIKETICRSTRFTEPHTRCCLKDIDTILLGEKDDCLFQSSLLILVDLHDLEIPYHRYPD